jgi:hypothetical protein
MSVFTKRTINPAHAEFAQLLCEERVTRQMHQELAGLVSPSKQVWAQAIQVLTRDGQELQLPFEVQKSSKTYALDGLAVARILGISDEDSCLPMQIFSLYYLSVHIIDDLAEDYPKFIAQFKITDEHASHEEQVTKEILPFSYTLNTVLTIFRMLMSHGRYAKSTDKIFHNLITSLGAFTHFFLLEQLELSPEKVLDIKQRGVSGIATSMIADLLCIEDTFSYRTATNIKSALHYLGSLTQFTDDLRDYDVDIARGNANLLVSLERKFKKTALEMFAQWYVREEELMLHAFHNCGLDLNTNLMRAIPWYPSVLDVK